MSRSMSRNIWNAGKRNATRCGSSPDEQGRAGKSKEEEGIERNMRKRAVSGSTVFPAMLCYSLNKVHFILGVHNHQPIGNFDFVFEKAYDKSYLPFLEVMERHPAIHWNMHTTGILWEWLEKHR